MHDKRVLAGTVAVLVLIMLGLVYLNFLAPGAKSPPAGRADASPSPALPVKTSAEEQTPAQGSTFRATLYFEGQDTDLLFPEIREIPQAQTAQERLRLTLEALIAGPTRNLLPVIPPETRLLGLFLLPDGSLNLDFSQELQSEHSGGSAAEIRTVFAIVDTVAVNFPDVKAVQILIEGRQVQTLAGHICLSRPLRPDWRLLNIR